nr:helix-loop-helix protein 2-like [Danaus plexippus plexippus]
MSSYGSTSPSDEGFDRYEPPFYCQTSHQGSPMEGGVFWSGAGENQEYEHQDVYHDTGYIGRNYAYEEMQILGNEPYDVYHNTMMHQNYPQNNGGETQLVCPDLTLLQAIPRYDRPPPSFVRVVKRRTTANKKERRRTQSINTAFTDLRECIPNVPPDTKLSKMVRPRSQSINVAFSKLRDRIPSVLPDTKMTKIKTLRLATSYISYLLKVLETDGEPAGGFRAELHHAPPRRRAAEALHSFL